MTNLLFSNTELASKLRLLSVPSGGIGSNKVYGFLRKLYFKLVGSQFSKPAKTLLDSVSIVLGFGSEVKMVRVHAPRKMLTRAAVIDLLSFWYRPSRQNPAGNVSANPPCPSASFGISESAPHNPMAGFFSPAIPHPVGWCDKNAFPEAAFKRFGKALRGKVFNRNLSMFNIHKMLSHALGCSFTARALSL